MPIPRNRIFVAFAFLLALPQARAESPAYELGIKALESMAGCYLVDYSYTETESLKPGYVRDSRVYDVNVGKSVKEWITLERISPTRLRLQHILFATSLEGQLYAGSELRHQAEDWEFDAPYLYEFVGPSTWNVQNLTRGSGLWTRRITNLDDGLRYQCAAEWKAGTSYPEWSCANYAPIPGRETRDMQRKDYNTLERKTRIVAYGQSWLERQDNVKTIHSPDGSKQPLARELGKNWYVRLPDSECAPAQAFMSTRVGFWQVLREAWDEVLDGKSSFKERPRTPPTPWRYEEIMALEPKYSAGELSRPETRAQAKSEIRALIDAYRIAN